MLYSWRVDSCESIYLYSRFPVRLCSACAEMFGQIAQLVERGPEKAGVGGSSPSLATK